MAVYNVREAQTHFPELIEQALRGEEVIITKAGKPVARIVSWSDGASIRVPGIDKGKIIIQPDFDDPLDEFEL